MRARAAARRVGGLGAALALLLACVASAAPLHAPAPTPRPGAQAPGPARFGPLPLRVLEDAFAAPPRAAASLNPPLAASGDVAPPAPRARPALRRVAPDLPTDRAANHAIDLATDLATAAATLSAPRTSPAPERRPRKSAALFAAAAAPRPSAPATASKAQPGAPVVPAALRADDAPCGDARLRGAQLPRIDGPGACGIDRPVRLEKVAGVRLERPVPVACETARALADWIEDAARPAVRAHEGVDIASITPFAGYACRPRNNRPGAKLSEHGHGRAIDIGAITLTDGREITVLDGWRNRDAALMRDLWRTACGPFGTVLGPKADRYHVNHFHFDTARHRGGPVCR